MCCTKKSSHKDRGARPLIVSNRLAQPVEASVLDAAIDENKCFNLGMLSDLSFGSSRVSLKTCFLKTKICCVRAPNHTTAVDYSFNTSGCGFYKNVGEVSARNRCIQSDEDGERQRLEPF